MREIKFRAWNEEDKRFDNYNLAIEADGSIWSIGGEVYPIDKDKYVISQYTGLKDRSGVEIYEGDIVRGTERWNQNTVFEIKYEILENCGDCFTDDGIGFNFHMNKPDVVKVIGNRFQNPELLEVNNGSN
jgi:uncharacterized phage protein (TIGR01671 family)